MARRHSFAFTTPPRLRDFSPAITASASGPLVRSAETDPAFRSPQSTHIAELPATAETTSAHDRPPSPGPLQDQETSRRSSASSLVQLKQDGNKRLSLPALSALASVASAPSSHYRYDRAMTQSTVKAHKSRGKKAQSLQKPDILLHGSARNIWAGYRTVQVAARQLHCAQLGNSLLCSSVRCGVCDSRCLRGAKGQP